MTNSIVEAVGSQHGSIIELLPGTATAMHRLQAASFVASRIAAMFPGHPASDADLLFDRVAERDFQLKASQIPHRPKDRLDDIGVMLEVNPDRFPSVGQMLLSVRSFSQSSRRGHQDCDTLASGNSDAAFPRQLSGSHDSGWPSRLNMVLGASSYDRGLSLNVESAGCCGSIVTMA